MQDASVKEHLTFYTRSSHAQCHKCRMLTISYLFRSNFLVLTSTDGNVLFIISTTKVLLTDGLNAQAL